MSKEPMLILTEPVVHHRLRDDDPILAELDRGIALMRKMRDDLGIPLKHSTKKRPRKKD